ncbi:protease modulator HflC [Candidatus Entotheonella palauensis]|uniref:protease modulator HflC n=1 Tax=Candidatus Entotheonella palauensis TaxID=93172 RepID=UPI000B7F5609|nr:protease modulator HflC [Candidatus Entotheonella palauensis]
MNRAFAPLLIVVVVVVVAIFSGVFYQVNEREQVIITQFGRPVSGPITNPGLKMKLPFMQSVRRFDKRILEWDGAAEQIPTLDKRFILLDTTARWRIVDPLRFLQAVGNERSAQSRLDDIIESAARDVVSGHELIQVVRNFQRYLEAPAPPQDSPDGASQEEAPASGETAQADNTAATPAPVKSDAELEERLGREELSLLMAKRAQEILPNLGIELIDVNIKRINYVREVEEKVYERMISERKRIAAQFRSEGDGESARIRGGMERELDQIQSEAYRQAQDIIGQGDAEAARIYAEAYGASPEFYSFVQTLETYKETMQGNANLLLTTDSDFYRYLKGDAQNGGASTPPAPRTSDADAGRPVN